MSSLVSSPHVIELVMSNNNAMAVMAVTVGARRQGHKAVRSVGAGSQAGQGCVVIDDVQNFRLDRVDLSVDRGNLSRSCGIDARHQRGLLVEETDDLVDMVERVSGDPLLRDGALESGLGGVEVVDDGLL